MSEQGSPSSGSFLAQGTVAGTGVSGYEISVLSRTLEERTPAVPGGEQMQPFKMQKEWKGSCSRLQKERNHRRCSRTKTHGSWNQSFNVSRTR